MALQHHERWNGRGGYPLGLSGEKIHRYARICAVADVYDAMTADRVYRRGLSPAEAIGIITCTRPLSPRFSGPSFGALHPFRWGCWWSFPTGEPVFEPYEIDLAEEAALSIMRRLPDLSSGWLVDVAN